MTIAKCFNCGSPKFGALTLCRACGRSPETEEEFMASMKLIVPEPEFNYSKFEMQLRPLWPAYLFLIVVAIFTLYLGVKFYLWMI